MQSIAHYTHIPPLLRDLLYPQNYPGLEVVHCIAQRGRSALHGIMQYIAVQRALFGDSAIHCTFLEGPAKMLLRFQFQRRAMHCSLG